MENKEEDIVIGIGGIKIKKIPKHPSADKLIHKIEKDLKENFGDVYKLDRDLYGFSIYAYSLFENIDLLEFTMILCNYLFILDDFIEKNWNGD